MFMSETGPKLCFIIPAVSGLGFRVISGSNNELENISVRVLPVNKGTLTGDIYSAARAKEPLAKDHHLQLEALMPAHAQARRYERSHLGVRELRPAPLWRNGEQIL